MTFVELPPFERKRSVLWSDDEYFAFQDYIVSKPEAGDLIRNGGGLRKVRFGHVARGKGKRGGTRVIYFWKISSAEILLFALYSKDENSDLSAIELKHLRKILQQLKDL